MVIEWLGFEVDPQWREKFIDLDREIWTATLAKCPGFMGKEIWLDPMRSDRIYCIIRWETREQWKAISEKLLLETEAKFTTAMGDTNYKMIEDKEYQIRKFPANN